MPVVVPALRVCYVFLNVFETFKTLRLPPPSTRNGGQPSARAVSQRKRAMKGCMAVWIVWCCFSLYERLLDGVVRVFIPFYDEIKSLVLLFFLLTRARGAEPIYLHCLRPLIKPHVATLDAFLEFGTSLGDLMLLLSAIPVDFLRDVYRRWYPSPPAYSRGEYKNSTRSSASSVKQAVGGPERPANDYDVGKRPYPPDGGSRSAPEPSSYQIWYPPPASYDAPPPSSYGAPVINPLSGLPTPPTENPPTYAIAVSSGTASTDEWRQYPPFPSAYPPTPLPTSSKLASVIVAPVPVRPSSGVPFSDIPEELMEREDPAVFPNVSAHTAPLNQQDFQRSLQLPRELSNPNSDGGLSDDDDMHGIQSDHDVAMSADEAMDDIVEEEEDDFDVTLRTPFSLRQRIVPPPIILLPSISIDSQASKSTRLSTTDDGSSLRTRTNSDASVARSDTSSVTGRKRRLLHPEDGDVKRRTRSMGKPQPSKLPLHVKPRAAPRVPEIAQDSSASTDTEDTGTTDSDISNSASVQHKRRKVALPPELPRAVSKPIATTRTRTKVSSTTRTSKAGTVPTRPRSTRSLAHLAGSRENATSLPLRNVAAGKPGGSRTSNMAVGKKSVA
ncbi:hypothetical protein BKA93DRAFT_758606 [Sparassis latifolia]